MPFEVEVIAHRFAAKPGYRFIAYRGIGIAIFAMNLRVLSLEPRDIPPIQEFIIKLMMEGVKSSSLVSDLLGLEQEVVRGCLVDLRRQEVIEVLSDDGNNDVQCVLTSRGEAVARALRQAIIQEITIPNVMFHGLLRQPVDIGGIARRQYLRPKEAQDRGLDLVRAIPNRYPYPDEIDVDKLDRVTKQVHKSKVKHERDIVAVRSVLKNVHTLYEPAVMLEYETNDDRRERLVSFAVDGQLRADYEDAFFKARGPELLAYLMAPNEEVIENRIREQASKNVIQKLGHFADAEILAAKVVAAKQEVEDKLLQLERIDRSDTREKQRQQIADLEKELKEAHIKHQEVEDERNVRSVKYLWTPEIREKLWEAIKTVQERLLILSGWISSDVLNDAMISELQAALKRGVKIWIGYGFDRDTGRGREQREQPKWKQAEAMLLQMQNEFPNQLVFRDIGHSHEKRLICDNRFTFGGSFNLLSFSGESRNNRKIRHEGADLIENSDFCEELWNRYLSMFFSSAD